MGSSPTHGVEVSEAVFASEVGDGGEEAVLSAVGVVKRNRNCNVFLHHVMKLFHFIIQKMDNISNFTDRLFYPI